MGKCFLLVSVLLSLSPAAHAEQYEVLTHRPETFGHISMSDGPAWVESKNQSLGNRFRLSAEIHFGQDSRFAAGWMLIDSTVSGEKAESVGDITRYGSGPSFGYFFIPDKLWLMYTFNISSAKGSRVSGDVTSYGHQLEVGYRFYSHRSLSLDASLNYLYLPTVTVPVYDLNSNNIGNATYPAAQIWGLGLVLGFDIY